MPAKRKLPRNAKRLPKGTTRDDYEPEVIEAWERDRWRQRKEVHRNRQRHRGVRDVTFALCKDAREKLTQLCKTRGMSKTQVITHLILESHDVQVLPQQPEPDRPEQ